MEVENNKLQVLRHGEIIINATPVKIVRYENPLNNQIKYQIDFISSVGQLFTIPPGTVEDITKELKMWGVVYKQRIAEEVFKCNLKRRSASKQSFNSATDRDSWLGPCGRQDSCI